MNQTARRKALRSRGLGLTPKRPTCISWLMKSGTNVVISLPLSIWGFAWGGWNMFCILRETYHLFTNLGFPLCLLLIINPLAWLWAWVILQFYRVWMGGIFWPWLPTIPNEPLKSFVLFGIPLTTFVYFWIGPFFYPIHPVQAGGFVVRFFPFLGGPGF